MINSAKLSFLNQRSNPSQSLKRLYFLNLRCEDSPDKIVVLHDSPLSVGKQFETANFNPQNGRVSLVFVAEFAVFDGHHILFAHGLLVCELKASLCEEILFHVEENCADSNTLKVFQEVDLVDKVDLLQVCACEIVILNEANECPRKCEWCV